jgi:hypothetical protein
VPAADIPMHSLWLLEERGLEVDHILSRRHGGTDEPRAYVAPELSVTFALAGYQSETVSVRSEEGSVSPRRN